MCSMMRRLFGGRAITHVVVPCATGDLQPFWAASGRPNSTAERNLVAAKLEPRFQFRVDLLLENDFQAYRYTQQGRRSK